VYNILRAKSTIYHITKCNMVYSFDDEMENEGTDDGDVVSTDGDEDEEEEDAE
jgi:hypothetical protein